ncbi:outer membrane efflux protein [Halanaerobium saccharolyticum]|uniref:Outer membrane efflux protein n=1 Tax=Halanaerobium saccharolyticum TaxID=43595 RepID=A0A4R7Z0Q2_9FIRM|nr:TolC family protein [Halanaerobium saccharolyticum]RAK08485.1 outer membrane efflux protein [Halanaerobium saccharolyticum]TDW03480.1 outer membrane efflux protein [Halanaerobium saccharolyticum]TDX59977.1 outer membrane efflux protein [Halanaerobium saccharolyticum]
MTKNFLFIFLTVTLLIVFTVPAAAEYSFNLQQYLEKSLSENREVKKAKINLKAKKIALDKEKAEQELRPSPLFLKKAETEMDIAERNLEITRDQVTEELISDFFSYYKAENSIAIHKKYRKILKKELANIKEKYKQGSIIKSDVMQAEVELKSTESNLKTATNTKKRAVFKLKQNLNLNFNEQLKINFNVKELKDWKLNKSLNELFNIALNKRIEIKEAETNKELQKINYQIASADYSSKLEAEQAKNGLKNAKNQLELIKDRIKLDVNSKYLDHQNSIAEIERYKKVIESLKEALRVKKLYFEEDYITGTELLETQVELYQSEINYSHAKIDYYLSLAELYLSTGDFEEMVDYETK